MPHVGELSKHLVSLDNDQDRVLDIFAVKRSTISEISKKLLNDVFFCFFFLSGLSFTNIHDSRDSRGRGRVSI